MPLPRTSVLVALVLAALAALTACTDHGPEQTEPGIPALGPPSLVQPRPPAKSVLPGAPGERAPLGGRQQAELELTGGASVVHVQTADLAGLLYRATSPLGSSVQPAATIDGDTVNVDVKGGNGTGPSDVDIMLNSAVSWTVRLDGGASDEEVDAAAGGVRELDFGAGASRIDVTLPRPAGTVPVNMTGGASSFALHLPDGVPAQVALTGGGGTATIDGTPHTGLGGGTVLTALDWANATDRYTITCTAGVSQLVLDRG